MRYEIGRASRTGNRDENQDRLAALESEHGVVLVLADGMGGQRGGALASQALIDAVSAELAYYSLPVAKPQHFLSQLLHKAHEAVREAGTLHDPPLTPGTTAVVCLIQENTAWWAHVGDSRLYLFRDGLALYRTRDHSYVEQLYQAGKLSMARRQEHPMRNYVTQCIGLQPAPPQISLGQGVRLKPGDILLLCSDGLWEPLDDATLGTLLPQGALNQRLNALTERAEQLSYPRSDNISALALRVHALTPAPDDPDAPSGDAPEVKDRLTSAIEQIERTIREYEDEMKR